MRELFAKARAHKKKHGYPAIICVDEAESLLGIRGRGRRHNDQVVTTFLAEMDGLKDPAALIFLLTNRYEDIDPAICRDGRIDRKIYVPHPSPAVVSDMFWPGFKGLPFEEEKVSGILKDPFTPWLSTYDEEGSFLYAEPPDVDEESKGRFARSAIVLLFSARPLRDVYPVGGGKYWTFGLGDLCTGAMVANVCRLVKEAAITESISLRERIKRNTGVASDEFVPVSLDHVRMAICTVWKDQFALNHRAAILNLMAAQGVEVQDIMQHPKGAIWEEDLVKTG